MPSTDTVGERVGLALTSGDASQWRSKNAPGGAAMSRKPTAIEPVLTATAQVAGAACPRGPVDLILRDALGPVDTDADGANLDPTHGQPGCPRDV
jgi:hypothetical protein